MKGFISFSLLVFLRLQEGRGVLALVQGGLLPSALLSSLRFQL